MGAKRKPGAPAKTHHFRAPGGGGNSPLCAKHGGSTSYVLWDRWDEVKCKKCLALKPKRIHHGEVGKRGNIHKTACLLRRGVEEKIRKGPMHATAAWKGVTCKKCLNARILHIFTTHPEALSGDERNGDDDIIWQTGCGIDIERNRTWDERITRHDWKEVNCPDCLKVRPDFDDFTHKLGADNLMICGKKSGPWPTGLPGADTWRFVDCPSCLNKKPDVIHVASVEDRSFLGSAASVSYSPGDDRWAAVTLCDQPASAGDVADFSGLPTCRDCLRLNQHPHHMKKEGTDHAKLCGAKHSSGDYPSSDPVFVTCVDCLDMMGAESVHELLEDSARILLTNALVAAHNRGAALELCMHCHLDRTQNSAACCILCAVLKYRDLNPWHHDVIEGTANLLSVPPAWVTDLVAGWDSIDTPPTYPTARKIGKRLWKTHH